MQPEDFQRLGNAYQRGAEEFVKFAQQADKWQGRHEIPSLTVKGQVRTTLETATSADYGKAEVRVEFLGHEYSIRYEFVPNTDEI